MHVHIHCAQGEAKFWMEPKIEVAQNYGLSGSDLRTIQSLIEDHKDEIAGAWEQHFGH